MNTQRNHGYEQKSFKSSDVLHRFNKNKKSLASVCHRVGTTLHSSRKFKLGWLNNTKNRQKKT